MEEKRRKREAYLANPKWLRYSFRAFDISILVGSMGGIIYYYKKCKARRKVAKIN